MAQLIKAGGDERPTVVDPTDPVFFSQFARQDDVDHLVVLIPTAMAGAARTALTLTAACAPGLRIARIVSDHSPLALDVALRAARESMRTPAAAVAFLHAALAQMWSGAWTPSAWTADQPVPIWERLRSVLPGTSYVVTRSPRVAVARCRRDASFVVPPQSAGTGRTLISQAPGLPQQVAGDLAAALGADSVVQTSFAGTWPGVIDSARAVQLALIPATMRRQQPPPPAFECRCGVRSIEAVCPFCRIFSHPLVLADPVVPDSQLTDPQPTDPVALPEVVA